MTHSEFTSQMKEAGIGGMYHDPERSVTEWISEDSNLYELFAKREAVKEFFQGGSNLIIRDESGNGFHVASMLCRTIIRYGITARMDNPFRLARVFEIGKLDPMSILRGIDVVVMSPFDPEQDPPTCIGLVEWLLREHIGEGGSLIVTAPHKSEPSMRSFWSKSFSQMIQNQSLHYKV